MDYIKIKLEPCESGREFEITLVGNWDPIQGEMNRKVTCSGDMVQERFLDVLAPYLRQMSNELDNNLKRLRRSSKD